MTKKDSTEVDINEIYATAIAAAQLTKMNGKRIAAIRKEKFNMTQVKFADFISIKYTTLCSWERNRYTPSSAAASLLLVAEQHPEIFSKIRKDLLKCIKQHIVL